MTFDDDTCKKIAQAIAMNAAGTARFYAVSTDANDRRSCEISLDAAGWALKMLGECNTGDDLGEVCDRLIARHNRMTSS